MVQVTAPSTITRELPALSFRASFVPSSINIDKRTVDVTWSTGAKVLRKFDASMDIWTRFYEVLSLDPKHVRLDRFNNSAPFCDGHPLKFGDPRTVHVRGVIVPGSAKTNGKVGTATVRFAKADADPEAERLFQKIADGIAAHASCGYRSFKAEKVEESADKIPVYRVIDWEPFELSAVSAGDDDGAVFRGAADADALHPCEFITPLSTADADRGRRLRLAHLSRRTSR